MMPGMKMELPSCYSELREEYLRIESAMVVDVSKEENTGERSHRP